MDTFNSDGTYNKTDWAIGDTITDTKLNKIEDAIYEINNNIPTNVSELNNDMGYLTENQAIEEYASMKYVDDVIANINLPEYVTENELSQNLENYVLKSEIPDNGIVSSNTITRIEIVKEYPDDEETGVLYIKVSD